MVCTACCSIYSDAQYRKGDATGQLAPVGIFENSLGDTSPFARRDAFQ